MPCIPLKSECGDGMFVRQRFIFTLMISLGFICLFITRVSLNVAITEMVGVNKPDATIIKEDLCPEEEQENITEKRSTYNWTEGIQQTIMSSFFAGYFLFHIPGGILADKTNAKHVFGIGALVSGILTGITPLAIKLGNWQLLAATRFGVGLAQGGTFPSVAQLMSRWIPQSERGLLCALVYDGTYLGSIAGNAISGLIIHYTGSWEILFYVWGAVNIAWYILYALTVSSDPSNHPCITERELNFIQSGTSVKLKYPIPWKKILSDPVVWALVAGNFGHAVIFFTVLTETPKYFKDVLRVQIKENGLLSSLPFMTFWIGATSAGLLCDCLISHNKVSKLNVRKSFGLLAMVIPSICLVTVAYIGCSKYIAMTFFALSTLAMGLYPSGIKLNVMDISINFQGSLTAIIGGLSALGGYLAPIIINFVAYNHTLKEWQIVFWIIIAITNILTVIYFIVTNVNIAQWDCPED